MTIILFIWIFISRSW